MQRIAAACVLLLVGAACVSAIGFSVSLRGGGGMGLGGDTISVFGVPSMDVLADMSGDYLNFRNRFVALGTGVGALASVDIEVFKNFSLEIMGGYSLGLQQYILDIKPTPGVSMLGSYTSSSIPASLTLKAKAPLGKVLLYAGAGPSFLFATKTTTVIDSDDGVDKEHIAVEGSFAPGFGYHGVVGVEIPLGKRIGLLVEARGEQLTLKPMKFRMIAYTVNGVDMLSTLTTASTQIVYVDDLSTFMNNPVDPDQPKQELAFQMPAHTIRIFLGMAVKL